MQRQGMSENYNSLNLMYVNVIRSKNIKIILYRSAFFFKVEYNFKNK